MFALVSFLQTVRLSSHSRTAQAVVDTEIVWCVLPFQRSRCSYVGHHRFVFRVKPRTFLPE